MGDDSQSVLDAKRTDDAHENLSKKHQESQEQLTVASSPNAPAVKVSWWLGIRGQLVVILSIVLILLIASEVYTFSVISDLVNQLNDPVFVNPQIIVEKLRNIENISFWFFTITLTVALSMMMYLLLVISQALRILLKGIKLVESGDLSHRIRIPSRNEFSAIGSFFNETASTIEAQVREKTIQIDHEKQLMSVVLSGIEEGVIALDEQDTIVMVNEVASKLLGSSNHTHLYGRSVLDHMELVYGQELLDIQELTEVARNNPNAIVFEESRLMVVGQDGKSSVVKMSIKCMRGTNNQNLSILTLRDVSKEIELEELKIDFVAMAAHQLRTPLTAMQGYLHLMIAGAEDVEERKRYIKRLLTSIGNLARLVSNLLDASKMEANTFSIVPETIDVQEVVQDAVEEQRTAYADESGVAIKYYSNPEKLQLLIDPLYIKEAVGNLLSNAVRNSKHGDTVEVHIDVDAESVNIRVTDSGPGIPKRAQNKLFQKFYRVYGGLESGSQGTGLGLYITRKIIEQHNGKVWVESESGHGATFCIGLPLRSEVGQSTSVVEDEIANDRDRKSFGWVKKTNHTAGSEEFIGGESESAPR